MRRLRLTRPSKTTLSTAQTTKEVRGESLLPAHADVDLSVCIVTYNGQPSIAEAIHSIRQHSEGLSVEILVCDNGSRDGTIDYIRCKFPEVHLLGDPRNPGYSPSMNRCVARAQGQFVLAMSQDAVVHSGALPRLIGFMRAHPRAAIAGPRTVGPAGEVVTTIHHPSLFVTVWTDLIPIRRRLRDSPTARRWLSRIAPNSSGLTADYSTTREVRMVDGGCLMFRRQALAAIGPLDELLPQGPDDYDICLRAREAGWQVWYVAESVVTHASRPREDIRNMPAHVLRIHLPQLCYLYRKHHDGPRETVFRLSALLLACKQLWQARTRFGSRSDRYRAARQALGLCSQLSAYRAFARRRV